MFFLTKLLLEMGRMGSAMAAIGDESLMQSEANGAQDGASEDEDEVAMGEVRSGA